jgi:hypothetical protein
MEFLEFLVREPKEVRVLLDVGAQASLGYYELDKMLTIISDAGNDEPAVGRALVVIKEGYNGRCILRRCGQFVGSDSGWCGRIVLFVILFPTSRSMHCLSR